MEKFMFLFAAAWITLPRPKTCRQTCKNGITGWAASAKKVCWWQRTFGKYPQATNRHKKVITDGPFVEAKEAVGGYAIEQQKTWIGYRTCQRPSDFRSRWKAEIRQLRKIEMPA